MKIIQKKLKTCIYSKPIDTILISDVSSSEIDDTYERIVYILERVVIDRYNIVLPNIIELITLFMDYLKNKHYIINYDLLPIEQNPCNIMFKFFPNKKVLYFESGVNYDN